MRILVVEDERKVADFVKRGLQEAQHVVDAAASIAEAEDLVSGQDYDLLIIDCMLPDGDGRHFCRDLRARGVAISVLLLTAKASTADSGMTWSANSTGVAGGGSAGFVKAATELESSDFGSACSPAPG